MAQAPDTSVLDRLLSGKADHSPNPELSPLGSFPLGLLSADQSQAESGYVPLETIYKRNMKVRPPDLNPASLRSLFFTAWQYALLEEALRGFTTRPVTDGETNTYTEDIPLEERPRGPRELALGGIAYNTPDRWTIWLNGQRIMPDAIPKEIIDLHVFEDYVEMKWFDSYTNMIFPLRLRAHQRFNLDRRLFLPGVSPDQ
ncbi:MAG: hypothetical protein KDJ15_04645 [Alphaproteobacteria bacterium]|nr:hypothetical protein [Alphaproteobacteria bacterium]